MAELHNLPPQKLIYETFAHIFVGCNAKIRSQHEIGTALSGHRSEIGYVNLAKSYTPQTIREVILKVLERGYFENPKLACAKWPGLFGMSALQVAQRATLEAEVAKAASQAKATTVMGLSSEVTNTDTVRPADPIAHAQELSQEEEIIADRASDSPPTLLLDQDGAEQLRCPDGKAAALHPESEDHLAFPSLFPLFLAYRTQHYVMTAAQQSLERCYYDWILEWVPDGIAAHQHGYPESIEIKTAIELIVEHIPKLQRGKNRPIRSGKDIATLWKTLDIRHVQTHRIPIPTTKVIKLVEAANKAADLLKDGHEAGKLARLSAFVQMEHQKLEQNSNLLEERIKSELGEIENQRLALLRMREDKILQYLSDDRSFKRSADDEFRSTHMKQEGPIQDILSWLTVKEKLHVKGTALQLEDTDLQEQEQDLARERDDQSEISLQSEDEGQIVANSELDLADKTPMMVSKENTRFTPELVKAGYEFVQKFSGSPERPITPDEAPHDQEESISPLGSLTVNQPRKVGAAAAIEPPLIWNPTDTTDDLLEDMDPSESETKQAKGCRQPVAESPERSEDMDSWWR